MLRLTGTVKLQVVADGVDTTSRVTVSYMDWSAAGTTGGTQVNPVNSTTPVDICTAPTGSIIRDIDHVKLVAAVARTFTFSVNDGSAEKWDAVTLAVGDVFEWAPSGAFVKDSTGAKKYNLPGFVAASGKTLTVSNSLTLAGTDGTTMTFPSSSATIARTDAANTFTGTQTFSGLINANAGISVPTAQSITGTGTAAITGFSTIATTSTVGVGGAAVPQAGIYIAPTLTLAASANQTYGFLSDATSDANTTTRGAAATARARTLAASYTMTDAVGFYALNNVAGAGSTITNSYGFYAVAQTPGATLNINYESVQTAGTGYWAFRASGGAQSGFAGNVRIGSVVPPTVALDVTGAALISSTLGVTGVLTASNTTDATAIGTAGVVNSGGESIAKNLLVGGSQIALTNATNGQAAGIKTLTELTTIAAAASTDTAIQMPANSIVLAVSVRVTTAVTCTSTFTVGDAGSAARFSTAAVSKAATSTDKGTKAGAYYNASAAAVRITPDSVPSDNTGRVRVTIYYIEITPSTS